MLKVSVKLHNPIMHRHPVELPPLMPGDRPATMTDYGVPGNRIIVFVHKNDGTVDIKESTVGITTEGKPLRELVPLNGLNLLKHLVPGDEYSLPITSKYGKADVFFQVV